MITGFPAVGDDPWELRFTRHALADLGADAARDTPGDIPAVRHLTTYSRVVEDFLVKRNDRPDAPGDPLHSVGRPDIISLHSAAGGRSVTWHDPDNAVVWFPGFRPEHDYSHQTAKPSCMPTTARARPILPSPVHRRIDQRHVGRHLL